MIIKTPLTDSDLERFLGKEVQENIITYSQIANFYDLEQLLPYDKSYKIILIEYEKNNGHWICILRYKNIMEIFNSFGTKHTVELESGGKAMNEYLGQSAPFLNELIYKEQDEGNFQFNLQ